MGWMLSVGTSGCACCHRQPVRDLLPRVLAGRREAAPTVSYSDVLIWNSTLINYRGVRGSTQVSNIFTVAKLLPLFLVAIAGTVYLLAGHKATALLITGAGARNWQTAALLLVFAYGGFETALTPLSEAKNPRRDAVFALFTGLITCTVLYTVIQWVVIGVLPDPAHSERPLADVARLALGPSGAAFVTIGALVSVYGYLSANILGVPRITFALAENRGLPCSSLRRFIRDSERRMFRFLLSLS